MQNLHTLWEQNIISTSGGISISVGDILLVLFLAVLGYAASRIVEHLLERRLKATRLRPDAVHIIKRASFYGIFLLLGFTILGLLGIPLTMFAFATGAFAIGIGFGAQNIINNFISGWILMAERPIRVDDFIEIEGAYGVVKRVGTRSTLIHRSDGVHMLVPNSKLLENTVVNWTLVDGLIRTTVRVGVAYGSDVAKTKSILEQCVTSQPEVLAHPQPEIVFDDFGDSALLFDCYFWCDVAGERSLRLIRSDIRFKIDSGLRAAGIVIAFPQRDLHLYTENPISVNLQPSDDGNPPA